MPQGCNKPIKASVYINKPISNRHTAGANLQADPPGPPQGWQEHLEAKTASAT